MNLLKTVAYFMVKGMLDVDTIRAGIVAYRMECAGTQDQVKKAKTKEQLDEDKKWNLPPRKDKKRREKCKNIKADPKTLWRTLKFAGKTMSVK